MSGGARRTGRAYALQLLYARDGDPATDLSGPVASWASEFELEIDAPAQQFAKTLVAAATERAREIDELIASSSKNWRLERMSRVDRNLLRLGTWELMFRADVPRAVVLDESVELAKAFGNDDSSAFVNGVLAAIADAVGR